MKKHHGNHRSNLTFLKKSRLLEHDKKILEIGSGTGAMVHFLQERGYKIVGSEVDVNRIAAAKRLFDIQLQKIDGSDLPFRSNSFDLVLSFDVLEHIPNTAKHLQEVHRVLKKDGAYLFSTPNKFTNIPFSIIKDRSFTRWKTYHCSLHSRDSLKQALIAAGFSSSFVDIPVVTAFFKRKLIKTFGWIGYVLLKLVNPDTLPPALKTNFFVIARK